MAYQSGRDCADHCSDQLDGFDRVACDHNDCRSADVERRWDNGKGKGKRVRDRVR